MLDLEDVSTGYVGVPIIQGLSLQVESGGIVSLLGANGAGKSTLLKAVNGLLKVSGGSIRFCGEAITNQRADIIAEKGLVQVPQGRRLFTRQSVLDNLLIGNSPKQARKSRQTLLDRVFGMFPILGQRRKQLAGTLSGGQQQMVAIGRALMANPRLLVLDEPTIGLAPAVVDELMASLQMLNSEAMTIFLVEQNVPQALAVSDFGYVLENGSIQLSGTASALRDDDRVRKAYLGV
jgi:branched-chain amino acid transport system ATP-binding protein